MKSYNYIKGLANGYNYVKVTLLAISAFGGMILLYLYVISPVLTWVNTSSIPDFPDCAGQPKVVVDYLQKMDSEARQMPTSDVGIGKLGMAYHAHMFYDLAQACYRRAIELNPKEWRWSYYLGMLHEELGDTKAVVADLLRVVEITTHVSEAWFRLGNAYLKTNSYQEAETALYQVLLLKEGASGKNPDIEGAHSRAFPLEAYATLQLARVRLLQKQYVNAKTLLESLIAANPTFGPAYRLLGSVCREMGQVDEGNEYEVRAGDFDSYVPPVDTIYNALVLCSRNTSFITKEMDIAVKREDYRWTVALINHILDYDPNNSEALERRLKLALDTQQHDIVEPLVEAYAKVFHSDEMRLLDMAKFLSYRGQYEASVLLLQRIITLNPKAMDAHIEFVRMLAKFKQYSLGVQYCNEVIAAEPDNPEIRLELAGLLIREGNMNRAKEQLRIAQKLHPDEEARWTMLGRMAKRTGDEQSAVLYYRNALRANPRNVALQLEYGEYLLEMRKWDDASKHLQNALQASPNNIDFMERTAWILAACPDNRIRDGRKALGLANRFALMKKRTVEQDTRCGMTLAVACGEMKEFERAVQVANTYLEKSKSLEQKDYILKLQSLLQLLEFRKPFRL